MTVTVVRGLVNRSEIQTAPETKNSTPSSSQISLSNGALQAQTVAAQAAATATLAQEASASVLRISTRGASLSPDKIRSADKAEIAANRLAEKIKDQGEGLDAHQGLSPTAARDHIVV